MNNSSESSWDRQLRVRTSGRDASRSDKDRYPYEPTPYSVLERLSESGYFGKKNKLVDFGSGKGRVEFFMSRQTGCKSVGVEYDERLYERAIQNQQEAVSGARTEFILKDAQIYDIPEDVDRLYFFNPFSADILKVVLEKVRESLYKSPRCIQLFFYYPSDEYLGILMMDDELMFEDEIDCGDLFKSGDPRERILIFTLGTDL